MNITNSFLHRLFQITSSGSIESLLHSFAIRVHNVVFVQVGAHDGKSGDLISKYLMNYPWRGVLVEPVPYLYERLLRNYGDFKDRLAFENVAIDSKPGIKVFHAIREVEKGSAPSWHTQLGSFSKRNILKHSTSIPGLASMIYDIQVRTMTVSGLLQKHSLRDPQLIAIDTEGYDGVIVTSLLNEGVRPNVILFEHKHLSWWSYRQCVDKLRLLGYKVFREGGNSIALL